MHDVIRTLASHVVEIVEQTPLVYAVLLRQIIKRSITIFDKFQFGTTEQTRNSSLLLVRFNLPVPVLLERDRREVTRDIFFKVIMIDIAKMAEMLRRNALFETIQ